MLISTYHSIFGLSVAFFPSYIHFLKKINKFYADFHFLILKKNYKFIISLVIKHDDVINKKLEEKMESEFRGLVDTY